MPKPPPSKSRPLSPGLPLPGGEDTTFSAIFTIHPENVEEGKVPSVTALLERKKLNSRPKAPPTHTPKLKRKHKVQPARRRGNVESLLIEWRRSQLTHTADPLGQALITLFKSGVITALFLSREQVVTADGSMVFSAKAYSGNSSRTSLWQGLQWNSSLVPADLWTQVLERGYVEIPPPETRSTIGNPRNALRALFGSLSDEFLVLFRVGQPEFCRGLILSFAPSPLAKHLAEVSTLLSRPLSAPK